jgi:hypothetical protein
MIISLNVYIIFSFILKSPLTTILFKKLDNIEKSYGILNGNKIIMNQIIEILTLRKMIWILTRLNRKLRYLRNSKMYCNWVYKTIRLWKNQGKNILKYITLPIWRANNLY